MSRLAYRRFSAFSTVARDILGKISNTVVANKQERNSQEIEYNWEGTRNISQSGNDELCDKIKAA